MDLNLHAMSCIPSIIKNIEAIYETDKLLFYTLAKNFKYYDHTLVTSGTLKSEITIKRIIGVLLATEKDETLKSKIAQMLIENFKSIHKFILKPSNDNFKEMKKLYNKNKTTTTNTTSTDGILHYLIQVEYYKTKNLSKDLLEIATEIKLDTTPKSSHIIEKLSKSTLILTARDKQFVDTFTNLDAVNLFMDSTSDTKGLYTYSEDIYKPLLNSKILMLLKIQFYQ